MKKDFIQFTYAYTTRKFDGNSWGGGIFSRTEHPSFNYRDDIAALSNKIVSRIQQDLPEKDKDMVSFGFNITPKTGFAQFDSTPYIFTSFNNTNIDIEGGQRAEALRGGAGYLAHVCVGDALVRSGYVIEYFGSEKNSMSIREIDNRAGETKAVQPYPLLSDNDVEKSKSDQFNPYDMRVFQRAHQKELTQLLCALMACMDSEKKVFILADDARKKDIPKWFAGVLMLLPPAVANTVSFNTFMPDPSDASKHFKLCGGSSVMPASKILGLGEDGFVFLLGDRLVSNNSALPTDNKLASLLRGCDSGRLTEWQDFSEQYYSDSSITLEDVYYLASMFTVFRSADTSVKKAIAFVNSRENIGHKYNNGTLENEFIAFAQDNSEEIGESLSYAQGVVETLIKLMASPNCNHDDIVELLSYWLFENERAQDIMLRCLGDDGGFNRLFGTSFSMLFDYFTEEEILSGIANGLSKNVFDKYKGRVDKRIVFCLSSFFHSAAFERESKSALRVITFCARELVRQNYSQEMVASVLGEAGKDTREKLRFLVDLSMQNGGKSHMEDTAGKPADYAECVVTAVCERGLLEIAMNMYGREESHAWLMRLLFAKKWVLPNSFAALAAILQEERNFFGRIWVAFDDNFTALCKNSFGRVMEAEIGGINNLSEQDMKEKIAQASDFIVLLKKYRGCGGYCDFMIKELDAFIKRLRSKNTEEEQLYIVRNKRVSYVISNFKRLPNCQMAKVCRKAQIELPQKAAGKDAYAEGLVKNMSQALLHKSQSKEESVKKAAVCYEIDKAVARTMQREQRVNSLRRLCGGLLMAVIFSLVVAAVVGAASYLIYREAGHSRIVYLAFTLLSFAVAMMVYWKNYSRLKVRQRFVLIALVTFAVIAVYMTATLLILHFLF